MPQLQPTSIFDVDLAPIMGHYEERPENIAELAQKLDNEMIDIIVKAFA